MLRHFGQPPPPDARPPDQVRFLSVQAEPWSDGKRIRVLIDLTPFQEFPNLDVLILDDQNTEVARTSIIENSEERLTFTMHLRGQQTNNQEYVLQATLGYPELPDVDRTEIRFTMQ